MKKNPKKAPVKDGKLYKLLVDGNSANGGTLEWSLPTADGPGEWHEIDGPLEQCSNGLHLTNNPARFAGHREQYNDYEVYEVETRGEMIEPRREDGDEYVARAVRLLRRLGARELGALGWPNLPSLERVVTKVKRAVPVEHVEPKGSSAAYVLVAHVWESNCKAFPHSWRRLNAAMRGAVHLAISAGLTFHVGDFRRIYERFRGGYWMSCDGAEGVYAFAVNEKNISACTSYEAMQKRPPLFWNGERVCIGTYLLWNGQTAKVTSFAASGVVACSYHKDRRLDRRYTITIEQLLDAEQARHEAQGIRNIGVILSDLFRQSRTAVGIVSILCWNDEQREAALEWAVLAVHDSGKKRVRPPEPPPHVGSAIDLPEAEQLRLHNACIAWETSGFTGVPSDHLVASTPPEALDGDLPTAMRSKRKPK